MSRFCTNGHQLEDSWSVCPYCQKTGYALSPTAIAKTRMETSSTTIASDSAPTAGVKTVMLVDRRKPPVVGWLVAMNGEQKGEDYRVREGQNILGAGMDADIMVKDDGVSPRHASIRYKDESFFLIDLDSSNGTFLNQGEQPIAREQLKDGDLIRIGSLILKFKSL
jgi:hypothetical protein